MKNKTWIQRWLKWRFRRFRQVGDPIFIRGNSNKFAGIWDGEKTVVQQLFAIENEKSADVLGAPKTYKTMGMRLLRVDEKGNAEVMIGNKIKKKT